MIAKNKHSPATLYLLNTKTANKVEEQRKSARLTFNKKKSSRSISQYQKWNIAKQVNNNNAPFQTSSRTNSQIKKLVLNKSQFGLQSITLQKKLSSILQIFNSHNKNNQKSINYNKNTRTITQADDKSYRMNRKSHEKKSAEYSLLSIKDMNQQQKSISKRQKKTSYMRTQSLLNHSQYEIGIQKFCSKIDRKFKQYQKLTQQWKLRYNTQENDFLLDDIVRCFKKLFNQTVHQYSNEIMTNLQYFQDSLTQVSKEYQIQLATLKQQLSRADNAKNIIRNLLRELHEKHIKGVICSKIFQDMQRSGSNIQDLIKNSKVYEQIIQLDNQKMHFNPQQLILNKNHQQHKSKDLIPQRNQNFNRNKNPKSIKEQQFIMKKTLSDQIQEDSKCYQQQKLDCVQNSSPENWNQNFQNRQSIKGVLKYIHNHNHNKNRHQNNESSSFQAQSSSLESIKIKRSQRQKQKSQSQTKNMKINMKIDNWKSFQTRDKIGGGIGPYKNIMSQR